MDEIKVGNKMVKARQYPWGTVQGMHGSSNAADDDRFVILDASMRHLIYDYNAALFDRQMICC